MADKLAQLLSELSSQPLVSYSGPAFRMHNPVWAWSPLSCEGAVKTGGRFNPKGSPALYFSLNANTCLAEVSAGISTKLIDPQVLCSYQITIDGLLDLRADHSETFAPPWRLMKLQKREPPGWKLYRAVAALPKIKGFIVPSYQSPGERNLVLLHWRKREVELHDPDGRMAQVYGDNFTL